MFDPAKNCVQSLISARLFSSFCPRRYAAVVSDLYLCASAGSRTPIVRAGSGPVFPFEHALGTFDLCQARGQTTYGSVLCGSTCAPVIVGRPTVTPARCAGLPIGALVAADRARARLALVTTPSGSLYGGLKKRNARTIRTGPQKA